MTIVVIVLAIISIIVLIVLTSTIILLQLTIQKVLNVGSIMVIMYHNRKLKLGKKYFIGYCRS